ncbi:MAG: HTH domain-containing protein [Chitinophagales bacterium]|nr:HTH domain-containing protein [Chitinophagales bacterium]
MKLLQQLLLLERIDCLIRRKATGSPEQLARRLNVSLRHTYRLINELKQMGFPIKYNRQRSTYEYSESIQWQMYLSIGAEKRLSIKGGNR